MQFGLGSNECDASARLSVQLEHLKRSLEGLPVGEQKQET